MIAIYFLIALLSAVLIMRQQQRKKILIFTSVFIVIQFAFLLYVIFNKGATELYFFTYDALGLLFFAMLAILAASTFYYSINYLDEETIGQYRIYFAAFVILCASITGAYFANNATISWILIEATTLSAALLIYHRRTPRALEAAWKYVFICSIGIALAYLGILFLSVMLKGQHELNLSYDSLRQAAQSANPLHLKIAFLLILTGYSAKMEIFPLYSIGIDANHAVPAPMSGFFSTALANLGFVAIFRIYGVVSVSEIAVWAQHVLMLAGIISILVAAVYLLQVTHYKRLFSYSTVENMGIAILAMSFGKLGCFYAVFHVLMHSLVKSTAFYSLSRVGKIFGGYRMEKIGNYFSINPIGMMALLLCLVGLIAVPPSPLFISELFMFKLTLSDNKWVLFAFFILVLCFILYALLTKILHIGYDNKPIDGIIAGESEKQKSYIQLLLLAVFFYFGIAQPQWLLDLINEILVIL